MNSYMHALSLRTSELVADPEFQDNVDRLVHFVQPNNASFLHSHRVPPNELYCCTKGKEFNAKILDSCNCLFEHRNMNRKRERELTRSISMFVTCTQCCNTELFNEILHIRQLTSEKTIQIKLLHKKQL